MATVSSESVLLEIPIHSKEEEDRDERGRRILVMSVSEAMNERLEELASRTPNTDTAQLINQAIGLYKAVSDAIRDGKRVGIVDDPEVVLDTEFVDF
jgi:hypothetical protein